MPIEFLAESRGEEERPVLSDADAAAFRLGFGWLFETVAVPVAVAVVGRAALALVEAAGGIEEEAGVEVEVGRAAAVEPGTCAGTFASSASTGWTSSARGRPPATP